MVQLVLVLHTFLANNLEWQSQSCNYIRQSFENCSKAILARRINTRGCEDYKNKKKKCKNTFARMESDCTLTFGLNAFVKSISYAKQSNLFLHFLISTSKRFSRSWGIVQCMFLQCLSMAEDCCLFIALNASIYMLYFLNNGVMTTPKRRILSFVFTVLCFLEICFNMNSFSLKIEMRNRSSLVNGSKTGVTVNSRQGNLTSVCD